MCQALFFIPLPLPAQTLYSALTLQYSRGQSAGPLPPARGLTAFGFFLCFATVMAALAAFLLAFPGTPLDRLWALNPRARTHLAPLGRLGAAAFLLLAILGVYTTRLWFQRRSLGWRLAAIALAIQAVGDAINFLRGEFFAGLVGLTVASALLAFLFSGNIRAAFDQRRQS